MASLKKIWKNKRAKKLAKLAKKRARKTRRMLRTRLKVNELASEVGSVDTDKTN